jgi:EpsI family protein
MSSTVIRALLAVGVLALGLLGQMALEASYRTPRPLLGAPLASLPMQIGTWVGRDEPMDPEILERTQADDHLNRIYEDPARSGRAFKLWLNYSRHGLNLRHTPEICLPSGGWNKSESQTCVICLKGPDGSERPVTRLVYSQQDVVQGIGFWYHIFGEGSLERVARKLPISSRSSHGRTTRGSSLTVEIFVNGAQDPADPAFREFAEGVMAALEPLLPESREHYHIP